MKRGKIELKRIEDKSSRQVSFSKRRTGLFKKARELSVLCDVELALSVFSSAGRTYEFSTGNSLNRILERYRSHSYPLKIEPENHLNAEKHHPECAAPDKHNNMLQLMQGFLEGQIVYQMNITDVIQLERQLDATLRQIRKVQEKRLMEEKRLQEKEIESILMSDEGMLELSHLLDPS